LLKSKFAAQSAKVPENNTLLRCFQYLSMETISYGDFCWNGECFNCQVWLEKTATEKPVLACRTKVEANMKIVRMSEEIKLEDCSAEARTK